MAGISNEFVQWYFSEIARAVARKLRINDWEWRESSELLAEIEKLKPQIRREITSFQKTYQEWASATHTHGTDAQHMIPLIQKREAALESLVKSVASAT